MENFRSNSAENSYLFTDELISDEGIEACKKETLKRIEKNESVFFEEKNLLNKYLNWKRQPDEVALFSLYAYADLEIPLPFDCLFNIDNPKEYTTSKLIVTQSIFEGFYPADTISCGHKHTLICKFEDGIVPDIIKKLYVSNNKYSDRNYVGRFKLGLCDLRNFDSISKRIYHVKTLREKYGIRWHEYDMI